MKAIVSCLVALMVFSCTKEPSIQKYFVQKTEDPNFVALDLSPSFLNVNEAGLSADSKKALESFEKMNILAMRLSEDNKEAYKKERAEVNTILKNEQYQELMHFNGKGGGASIKFVGDENNIEEFILFADSKDLGFAVIRVLGENMTPTDIMNFVDVLKQSNFDSDQLKPLQDVMKGI
jgi:hypothetical protein